MEMSVEIEQETTMEAFSCREDSREDFPSETLGFRTEQLGNKCEENILPEEQAEVQGEKISGKLNLKQQLDVQKLIFEESKQYINIEEWRKLMKSAMEQHIAKMRELIQLLKQKIRDAKNVQRRAEAEVTNEYRKWFGIKNFTESIKEIVDVLRNYVEGFEQQIEKLKFAELQKKVLQKYEESCQIIRENNGVIKRMKSEISNIKQDHNVAKNKLRIELGSKKRNLKTQEESLRKDLDILLQGNQQLRNDILKIDNDLSEKQEDEVKISVKMKELYNSQMIHLEELKSNSLKIQKLEFEREDLLKSIDHFSSSIDILMEEVETLSQENSAIETQSKILGKDIGDASEEAFMEKMQTNEMEDEQQYLKGEIQSMEKQVFESSKFHGELVMLNHEKELTLLKKQNISIRLEKEMLSFQDSNEKDNNKIEELKSQVKEMERETEKNRELIEKVVAELASLANNKEHLQITLENLQQDIKDKNDQLSYQRNTLQIHLENKLKDLENKLEEVKKKNKEEKETFTKMEAVNKKKNEQYNRLRHVYLMLKTSPSEMKPPKYQRFQISEDIRQKNIEKIEAENSPGETSPKSILKSPGKARVPSTPTKNVKFVGVPSIASSNSSEMVNANKAEEKLDTFDELKGSQVQRKKNRTFD